MLFLFLLVLVFYFWIFTSLSCQLRYTFRQLQVFCLFFNKKIPFNTFWYSVPGMLHGYLTIMLLYFWKWKSEVDYFYSFRELWLTNKNYVYLRYLTCCFDIHIHCDDSFIGTQMSSSGKFRFAAECVYTHYRLFFPPYQAAYLKVTGFVHAHLQAGELGIEKCNYFQID